MTVVVMITDKKKKISEAGNHNGGQTRLESEWNKQTKEVSGRD